MKTAPQFHPLVGYRSYSPDEMLKRSQEFLTEMRRRRTVRDYAPRPIPPGVIENCVHSAGTAPCGANQQPWHFAIVRSDEIKQQIRDAAEKEEAEFYNQKATQAWLDALAHLGTDQHKPFLELAPALIVIFAQAYSVDDQQKPIKNYHVNESVGIATGVLITALHHAGLATLTHTPSNMKFLNQILNRPANERPFLILVTGYPAETAKVPAISKKTFEEITSIH